MIKGETRMKIDIDKLTDEELIDLNHPVVARLQLFEPDARAFADAQL